MNGRGKITILKLPVTGRKWPYRGSVKGATCRKCKEPFDYSLKSKDGEFKPRVLCPKCFGIFQTELNADMASKLFSLKRNEKRILEHARLSCHRLPRHVHRKWVELA